MLFITRYSYPPKARDAVIARFKETGGLPPAGIKLLGRWTLVAGGGGFHLCEASDASLFAKWAMQWNDLMTIESHPVLDDQQLAGVL
jgi:hypothetical protein